MIKHNMKIFCKIFVLDDEAGSEGEFLVQTGIMMDTFFLKNGRLTIMDLTDV